MNEPTQNKQPPEDQSEENVPLTPGDVPAQAPSGHNFKLTRSFALGFLGWYLVVWLIYWLLLNGDTDPQGYGAMILSLFAFPTQIIALFILLLVKKFRQIGWGMLSAIASNLLISLILGLGLNALCFIPFFFQ